MIGNQEFWEKQYAKTENNLWGLQPIHTLVEYTSLLESKSKVLDLGLGEGRNALYFSRSGFVTEGIDISETAVLRAKKYAEENNLAMKAEVGDVTSFEIKENTYSLIILANVLNFFQEKDIKNIIEKAKKGLMEDGFIYINVFDRKDPSLERNRNNGHQRLNDLTFYRQATNSYIHYFSKEELMNYFTGYQTIKMADSYLLDINHGEPHYHSIIEMLVKKEESLI